MPGRRPTPPPSADRRPLLDEIERQELLERLTGMLTGDSGPQAWELLQRLAKKERNNHE